MLWDGGYLHYMYTVGIQTVSDHEYTLELFALGRE
jgi:hypothetical protein